MVIKAVGFDFDGTLIASEGSKGKIMAEAFKKYLNFSLGTFKKIVDEYPKLVGKGNSREMKINILASKVIGEEVGGEIKKKIAEYFGKKYIQSMNHCPLFACNKMVEELQGQVKHLFLLSLEDQKEVRRVAKHCDLAKYFEEILGGPKNKVGHLKSLLKKWKLKPSEMLFIGDSHGDVIEAKKVGIKTILIDSKIGHRSLHKMLGVDFEVSSLCDVKSVLKQMMFKFVK